MKHLLKRVVALATLALIATPAISFNSKSLTPESHQFDSEFTSAYLLYPEIPKGLLEAISFSYTRIHHLTYDVNSVSSCIGLPRTYGVMGLTDAGKGFFKNNLKYVSVLSGYSKEELKSSPEKSIHGYASAFTQLLNSKLAVNGNWKDYANVLRALSELPSSTPHQDFALNSQLYVMFWFLNQPEFQTEFNFPDHNINMSEIFGVENYKVLSSSRVDIGGEEIKNDDGISYQKMPGPCADFPGSIWIAADASNFSSRSGTAISAITIHDIEGSYAGAISWFQNPISGVSAHYCIRSIDGQVTQMVCDADKGWHVGSENPYTIGLEHEGIASIQGWYTEELYQASAAVCIDAMNDYNIDPLRAHTGPPESGLNTLGACIKIKGHQHFPSQSHVDPGIYWDWDYFYRLLNDGTTPVATSITSASGSLFDSGGSGGNYNDDERLYWLIEPAGATSVTLTFSQFDLETNWDYLYIYDGNSIHDDLIGIYTGTTLPPSILAESGTIFLEFRSDCSTNNAGWSATYTSSTAPLSCPVPTGLTETNLIPVAATLNWVGTASSYLLRFRDHTYDPWTYMNVSGTSQVISGLSANSEYYWGVASICPGDTSNFAGSNFITAVASGSFSISECEGDFRDSGGPLGVYLNAENYTYTINASGPITMNFSSFDVENTWDFLYIYDGNSTGAIQIAGSPFTGTTSPGTFTSSGNSLTFQFTSDASTTTPGWNASWTCASTTLPIASFSPSTTNICTGDSIQLLNSSTDATSYTWSIPGGTPSTSSLADPWISFPTPGSYFVELIASGSTGIDTSSQNITVSFSPSPLAGAIPNSSTLFLPAATVTFTNISTDATSYLWGFGDGSTSTDTNPWNSYGVAGLYNVMLVAINGNCDNDTIYIQIEVMNPLGVADENEVQFSIAPNPSDDVITFSISNTRPENGQILLFDLTGKLVLQKNIVIRGGDNNFTISKSQLNLAGGQYLLKITTHSFTHVERIIFR
ncbi:MAG: N-acetylmuramoyl-L-alanine amidase [Flavobacteriales bacterium]|nr:N-acetylmuramoyl-L-alanine amidase [Flavobacteriales bacterium]